MKNQRRENPTAPAVRAFQQEREYMALRVGGMPHQDAARKLQLSRARAEELNAAFAYSRRKSDVLEVPAPSAHDRYVRACLAEGGFVWREIRQGRVVEHRVAA